MTGEPDLISLLHRADSTRLCLSAEVNDGSTLLIAPGKRYRRQNGERVTGCDGDRRWELPGNDGEDGDADGRHGTVHLIGGPEPPLHAMLCPAWLLMSSRLEVRGPVSACGRDALHVVVTRRPGIQGRIEPDQLGAGRVEAIVDAELGILLRIARIAGRDAPDVTELTSLEVNPDVDPAQFAPPPGSLISESLGEMLGAVVRWWAGKAAAGLAAGGLGAWIRYSPFGPGHPPRRAPKTPRQFRATIRHPSYHRRACLPGRRSAPRCCGCCMTAAAGGGPPRWTTGWTSAACSVTEAGDP